MRSWILAAAIAVVAAMTFAATASADVPRYQLQTTATFTVTEPAGAVDQWNDVWTHTYTVEITNPCGDRAFTGTATAQTRTGGATEGTGETIVGTFNSDGTISYVATRTYDGRTWTVSYAPYDTIVLAATNPPVTWDIDVKISEPVFTPTGTIYKNHGQYVREHGDDAAHSCIGMPIVLVPYEWSATGSIDSTSLAGSTVTLPRAGTYRIDILGDWQGAADAVNMVDAEYVTHDAWLSVAANGDQGDLQVNGQFVDWGAYDAGHAYTLAMPLSGSVNLAVFDGDPGTNTKNASWYGDNVGSLSYTITYVGP